MIFTPTPLQKATAVKPWMNADVFLAKREADKATPVKVWRFTFKEKEKLRMVGIVVLAFGLICIPSGYLCSPKKGLTFLTIYQI